VLPIDQASPECFPIVSAAERGTERPLSIPYWALTAGAFGVTANSGRILLTKDRAPWRAWSLGVKRAGDRRIVCAGACGENAKSEAAANLPRTRLIHTWPDVAEPGTRIGLEPAIFFGVFRLPPAVAIPMSPMVRPGSGWGHVSEASCAVIFRFFSVNSDDAFGGTWLPYLLKSLRGLVRTRLEFHTRRAHGWIIRGDRICDVVHRGDAAVACSWRGLGKHTGGFFFLFWRRSRSTRFIVGRSVLAWAPGITEVASRAVVRNRLRDKLNPAKSHNRSEDRPTKA